MREKDQRRHPAKPIRPPKPIPTTTTHPPATTTTQSPLPEPVPSSNRYTIRIYDYCNVYSKYVVNAANYYATWMAPYGVDVQYYRMDVMDGTACWSLPHTPDIGIRMCEDLAGGGTAGSTGMSWMQTGPNAWALSSQIIFNAGDWDYQYGCDTCDGKLTAGGDYLACHELGHSTGNLPHRILGRPGDLPRSCMSETGSYAPSTLLDSEKAHIISLLPQAGSVAQMGLHAAFAGCDLKPPSDEHRQEAKRRHHDTHHRHHQGRD